MKTETVLWGFALLATILKIIGITGAHVLLLTSFGALSLVYHIPGIYFYAVEKIKAQNWFVTVFAILFLPVATLSILFRIMQWSGAIPMLYISIPGVFVVAMVAFLKRKKDLIISEQYYSNMLFRCGLLVGVATLVFTIFPGQ